MKRGRGGACILVKDILKIYIISTPQMKYLAAYSLLALSGKKDISAADIKAVLGSVASTTNDEDINKVISLLKGKSIHELIAAGQGRLGASAPVSSAPAATPAASSAPKKQQPKPKKEEPKPAEEEDDADIGDLFG